jgi:hypothetical protein
MIALLIPSLGIVAAIEDLPIIDPCVSVYQQSSHNKQGLNGDGGFYLYSEPSDEPGLAGWVAIDEGATAEFSPAPAARNGRGALLHTITDEGLDTGWRSIAKPLSQGLNLSQCDRVTFWVWPSYADGGIDYGIRIDSGGRATEVPIRDLVAGEWNHVTVDVSDVPRDGVGQFWLLFNKEWGYEDGMTFLVDDIAFEQPDGARILIDDFESGPQWNVVMDTLGPGCLRNMWGLGGDSLRIEVDGEVIVDADQTDFFEGRVPGYEPPLVSRKLVAGGPWLCIAHWAFVPIPFRERCRVLTNNPFPFNHYIYERYRDPARAAPEKARADTARFGGWFERLGSDPKEWEYSGSAEGAVTLQPGEGAELARLQGAGAIGRLELDMASTTDEILQGARIRIWWDGEPTPSVDAPIGHLFGIGESWRPTSSLMVGVRDRTGYCYFPMPFWRSAVVRIENESAQVLDGFRWRLAWTDREYPQGDAGYFRTWFHRDPHTALGRDYLFLEVPGRGQLVGVVHTLLGGHYCEGDIRFYVDGSRTPGLYGTGTEDYYHSACWPNIDQHTPFHGCVGDVQAEAEALGLSAYDIRSCYYRFHLEAPIRFQDGIKAGIEHGGTNDTDSSYTSLAFYYSLDSPGLLCTDVVEIGDAASEAVHDLRAESATRYSLEGFFEGDDDDVAWSFDGLATPGAVSVDLAIDPANRGLRLRRVFDQLQGRQRAYVYVDGDYAGEWYDPDENQWMRLAESDFEAPASLTQGKRQVTVSFRKHPDSPPWSVLELRALCYLDGLRPQSAERVRNTPSMR